MDNQVHDPLHQEVSSAKVSSPDPLALEVRRLAAAIESQREELAWLSRRLLARDDARSGALIVSLATEVHPEPFVAAELAAAALNDRTAVGAALRDVLKGYIDSDGGFRALARLLDRIEGVAFDGHRLVGVGPTRAGRRYRIQIFGP